MRVAVAYDREVVVYERFKLEGFDWEIKLVFWIGGRLWEVVAHGGSSVWI